MKQKITVILVLFIATTINCSKKQERYVEEPVTINLSVSQTYSANSLYVKYCGMINDSTFSFSSTGRSAVNFYYPISSDTIYYDGELLKIIKVNKKEIKFLWYKKQR